MRNHSFTDWLFTAPASAQHCYHEGTSVPSNATVTNVRKAYDAGLVDLVQRRLSYGVRKDDGGKFAYIAVKRARVVPIKPPCRFADVPDIARRM